MLRYLEFQGLTEARVELVEDLLEGLERVREEPSSFLVQCSAHPDVHIATERYREEVLVVDTFLYPAKEMALLARVGVENPRTLGIVAAALGYTDPARWEKITEESANPIVARELLAGKYDAAVTLAHYAAEHPDALRLLESFGEVETTWLVYGRRQRFTGELIGHRIPWFFTDKAEPQAPVAQAGVTR